MAGDVLLGAQIPPPGGLSGDTRALLLFEANRTEAVIAYILLFTLGLFGAHNFYLGRTGIAITQLVLTLIVVGIVVSAIWVLIDAFLVPGIVRAQNNALAQRLGA